MPLKVDKIFNTNTKLNKTKKKKSDAVDRLKEFKNSDRQQHEAKKGEDQMQLSSLGRKLNLLYHELENDVTKKTLQGFKAILTIMQPSKAGAILEDFIDLIFDLHDKESPLFTQVFTIAADIKDRRELAKWLTMLVNIQAKQIAIYLRASRKVIDSLWRGGKVSFSDYLKVMKKVIGHYGSATKQDELFLEILLDHIINSKDRQQLLRYLERLNKTA